VISRADALVFPSRTETFGVLMLEANACGVPVAAYPATGPIDVIKPGVNGALAEDLDAACDQALRLDPGQCRAHALQHSWDRCAKLLLDQLTPSAPRQRHDWNPSPLLQHRLS
jgi:glycosyltransferase involved in cell wall biosynthesis